MEMRQSFYSEILALLLAGISGIMIYNGKWYLIILGFLLLIADSYVINNLKKNTIKEYIKAVEEQENKKLSQKESE